MSTIRNVPAPCAFDEPATAADLGAGPPLLIADAGAMTGTSSTQRGANGKEKLERDIQGRSNGAWHPVVVPGGEVEVSFSCWDGQGRAVYKVRGARSTVPIFATSFEEAALRAKDLVHNRALRPQPTLTSVASIPVPGTDKNIGELARDAWNVGKTLPLPGVGVSPQAAVDVYDGMHKSVARATGSSMLPPLSDVAVRAEVRRAADSKLKEWSRGTVSSVDHLAEFKPTDRTANGLRNRLDRLLGGGVDPKTSKYITGNNSIGISRYKQLMSPRARERLDNVVLQTRADIRQRQEISDLRLPVKTEFKQGRADPLQGLSQSTRGNVNAVQHMGNKLANSGIPVVDWAGEVLKLGVDVVKGTHGVVTAVPRFLDQTGDLFTGRTRTNPGEAAAGAVSGAGKFFYGVGAGLLDLSARVLVPGQGRDWIADGSQSFQDRLDQAYRAAVKKTGVDPDSAGYQVSSTVTQVVGAALPVFRSSRAPGSKTKPMQTRPTIHSPKPSPTAPGKRERATANKPRQPSQTVPSEAEQVMANKPPRQAFAEVVALARKGRATSKELSDAQRLAQETFMGSNGRLRPDVKGTPEFKQFRTDQQAAQGYISGGVKPVVGQPGARPQPPIAPTGASNTLTPKPALTRRNQLAPPTPNAAPPVEIFPSPILGGPYLVPPVQTPQDRVAQLIRSSTVPVPMPTPSGRAASPSSGVLRGPVGAPLPPTGRTDAPARRPEVRNVQVVVETTPPPKLRNVTPPQGNNGAIKIGAELQVSGGFSAGQTVSTLLGGLFEGLPPISTRFGPVELVGGAYVTATLEVVRIERLLKGGLENAHPTDAFPQATAQTAVWTPWNDARSTAGHGPMTRWLKNLGSFVKQQSTGVIRANDTQPVWTWKAFGTVLKASMPGMANSNAQYTWRPNLGDAFGKHYGAANVLLDYGLARNNVQRMDFTLHGSDGAIARGAVLKTDDPSSALKLNVVDIGGGNFKFNGPLPLEVKVGSVTTLPGALLRNIPKAAEEVGSWFQPLRRFADSIGIGDLDLRAVADAINATPVGRILSQRGGQLVDALPNVKVKFSTKAEIVPGQVLPRGLVNELNRQMNPNASWQRQAGTVEDGHRLQVRTDLPPGLRGFEFPVEGVRDLIHALIPPSRWADMKVKLELEFPQRTPFLGMGVIPIVTLAVDPTRLSGASGAWRTVGEGIADLNAARRVANAPDWKNNPLSALDVPLSNILLRSSDGRNISVAAVRTVPVDNWAPDSAVRQPASVSSFVPAGSRPPSLDTPSLLVYVRERRATVVPHVIVRALDRAEALTAADLSALRKLAMTWHSPQGVSTIGTAYLRFAAELRPGERLRESQVTDLLEFIELGLGRSPRWDANRAGTRRAHMPDVFAPLPPPVVPRIDNTIDVDVDVNAN